MLHIARKVVNKLMYYNKMIFFKVKYYFWKMKGGFIRTRRIRARWRVYMDHSWRLGRHSWYDHRIDELAWPSNIFWVERGVIGRIYLKRGGYLLDLCCGDGYFSDLFWSCIAEKIDAVDRDSSALQLAEAKHMQPNISYHKLDIVKDLFPGKEYDVVCFFEAIEHLSYDNGIKVLNRIFGALKHGGTLVGGTTKVVQEDRGKGNYEHDNEFESLADLDSFISKVFDKVTVFSTYHPKRETFYFIATKSLLDNSE